MSAETLGCPVLSNYKRTVADICYCVTAHVEICL